MPLTSRGHLPARRGRRCLQEERVRCGVIGLGRRSNSFSAGGAEIFNAVITAPQPFLEWIRFTTWANDDYKHLSFALGESNDKSPGSNCLRLRGSGSCQWGKAIGSSMLPTLDLDRAKRCPSSLSGYFGASIRWGIPLVTVAMSQLRPVQIWQRLAKVRLRSPRSTPPK